MSSDRVVANVISLSNSSTVMQVPTTGTNTFKIDLAAMTITIDSTSAIDAIARGFLGGGQTGSPFGGNGTTLGLHKVALVAAAGALEGLGGSPTGLPTHPIVPPRDRTTLVVEERRSFERAARGAE